MASLVFTHEREEEAIRDFPKWQVWLAKARMTFSVCQPHTLEESSHKYLLSPDPSTILVLSGK